MYAKLFSRIAQSSLMEEKVSTRYVFMMMLALADRRGDVIGTDVAIARMMNVDESEFSEAILPLLAPDPDSNSRAEEGRRLIPSDHGRGYKVVNYESYRDMKSDEEKRDYMRNYMRERRAAGKDSVTAVNLCKTELSDVTHTDTDTDTEAITYPTLPKGRGISQEVCLEVIELSKAIKGSNATEFHDCAEKVFGTRWTVTREYPVNDRGDGRIGRVDLVIHHPSGNIGVELDRLTPRQKSIFKLTQNFKSWMVLLRGEDNTKPAGSSGRRLTPAQRRITKVATNTEAMIRINGWFGRRPDTFWTLSEADALETIAPSAAELDGMEAFYLAQDSLDQPLHRRTAVITLLNNWPSELDKARGYARKQRQ